MRYFTITSVLVFTILIFIASVKWRNPTAHLLKTSHLLLEKTDLLYTRGPHHTLLKSINDVYYRTAESLTNCLDDLSASLDGPTQLYFIGDSRIRQQFYSFLNLLPSYDRVWNGQPKQRIVSHYDMNVTFPILNLQVLYRWRHIIHNDFIAEIEKWPVNEPSSSSVIFLIGINVHHMFPETGWDYRDYVKQLDKLAKPLENLSSKIKVVWMLNQDINDGAVAPAEFHSFPIVVHSKKTRWFNRLAQNAFNRYKGLKVVEWNSDSVNEFIRACGLYWRYDVWEYLNCRHYIHLGYVVIELNTRIFVNHLCDISNGAVQK